MDFVLINIGLALVAICSAVLAVVVLFANAFGVASGGKLDERPSLVLGFVSLVASIAFVWRLWGSWGLAWAAIVVWVFGAAVTFRVMIAVPLLPRGLAAVLWPLLLFGPTRKRLLALVDFPEIHS